MANIEKTVIECAAEAYGVDAATITLDTDIREELSNQSLKLVAFISAIEDELDVQIDLADAGKLKTIRDFVEKLSQTP
jgi:acyl carrier protein